MNSPNSIQTSHHHESPSGLSKVWHRWPILLGLLVAAAAGSEMLSGDITTGVEQSVVIAFPVVVYASAAILARKSSAWPLIGIVILGYLALRTLGIDPVLGLIAATAAILLIGILTRRLHLNDHSTPQIIGAIAFGTTAVTALYVTPTAGALLVAGGLIAHATWDAYHHRHHLVVTRSFAEFCAALDLTLGLAILTLVAFT